LGGRPPRTQEAVMPVTTLLAILLILIILILIF
jgi:hypothetical protein